MLKNEIRKSKKKVLLVFLSSILLLSFVSAQSWSVYWNEDIEAYYKFDGSTLDAIDELGLHNGDVNGASRLAVGYVNDAYDYVKVDRDWVTLWDYDPENFTFSMFINIDPSIYGSNILSDRIASTYAYDVIVIPDGELRGTIRTDEGTYFVTTDNGTSLSNSTWYWFALTYDGEELVLYVDGVEQDKNTDASGSLLNTNNNLTVGAKAYSTPNSDFDGRTDELAIWSRALSQQELLDIYNNGSYISYFVSNPPEVSATSPNNSEVFNQTDINISCYVTDDFNLTSISLYVNDVLSQTSTSGNNATTYIFPLNDLEEGDYDWYCFALDSEDNNASTSERTFTIDLQLFQENFPNEIEGEGQVYITARTVGAGITKFSDNLFFAFLFILLLALTIIIITILGSVGSKLKDYISNLR